MSNSRFIICEDGTFKLLDLFHNYIVIKNTKENGKIIIDLSSITEIIPIKDNNDEILMRFISNGIKKTHHFFCQDRLYLLNKIITMKDRSSKIISDYSIETFKCYLMINMDEKKKVILKKIGKLLSENIKPDTKNPTLNNQNLKINDYIVFCTLYRTYMCSTQLTNKELKNYYMELKQIIKIKIIGDIYALILENRNEIEMAIIPFNKEDLIIIKNLIISYAEKYLCYEIKHQEKDDYFVEKISSPNFILNKFGSSDQENKIIEKSSNKIKEPINISNEIMLKKEKSSIIHQKTFHGMGMKKIPSLFVNDKFKYREQDKKDYLFIHYNVNRIGYNENKLNLILKSNNEYINLFSVNNEKITQIKLTDIFAIIINGTKDNYFEIILENQCRYIFEVENKNDILNDLIELLLKHSKNKIKFLILSYKISLKRKYNLSKQDGMKDKYEEYLIEQIKSLIFQKDNIKFILEEIILNFFFREGESRKIEDLLLDYSITESLIEKVDSHYNNIINIINDKTKDDHNKEKDIKNSVIILNLLFIFFKNFGMHLLINSNGKKICDKIFDILSKELKNRYKNKENIPIILNDYALFYNSFYIFEYFSLYKQMMLLKIFSFNRENRVINLENEIDLDSIFINTLLIIFENKLLEVKEIPNIYIPETSYFFFLFILYKIFLNEPSCTIRNGISFLSSILERVVEKKQREIKDVLLKKTLIIFIIIKLFIINNNMDSIITKNCLKLFQILIPQYYEMTIPIKNLFPNTLIKILGNQKDPDKWDKIQCDKFFTAILKDYSEEKIVWNNECKKELIISIKNLTEEYEKSVNKKISTNLDMNFNNNDEHLNEFEDLINIVFNTDNYISIIPDDFYKKRNTEIKPFYNIDYKNFKVNYKTLKKEVYILDTYINQLINNKKDIIVQKPRKFWKKFKDELINNKEEQRIIILKAMILLYKKYYLMIGDFDYYNIAKRIYKSTNSDKVRSLLLDLLMVSISIDDNEIKQNNIIELNKEEINFNLYHKNISK